MIMMNTVTVTVTLSLSRSALSLTLVVAFDGETLFIAGLRLHTTSDVLMQVTAT